MKIEYEYKNFHSATLKIISHIDVIVASYNVAGMKLTVRQLYYQLVAKNIISNTVESYKKIVKIVADARKAGLIDWDVIEDRTRYVRFRQSWQHPGDILLQATRSFHLNRWQSQKFFLIVLIEKDALVGVIENICKEYDVPYIATRGYLSVSTAKVIAEMLENFHSNNYINVALHLGDHDPSGLDMTRDLQFQFNYFGANVNVKRIALNLSQINKYNPPPNPAKKKDSRYKKYEKKYGNECWELDALDPRVLIDILKKEIRRYIDFKVWEKIEKREKEMIDDLSKIANRANKKWSRNEIKQGV